MLPASMTTPRLAKVEHVFRRKDDMLAVRLNEKRKFTFYLQCTKQMLLVRETDVGRC